eukprot:2567450-Rhodomonas_salina.1
MLLPGRRSALIKRILGKLLLEIGIPARPPWRSKSRYPGISKSPACREPSSESNVLGIPTSSTTATPATGVARLTRRLLRLYYP